MTLAHLAVEIMILTVSLPQKGSSDFIKLAQHLPWRWKYIHVVGWNVVQHTSINANQFLLKDTAVAKEPASFSGFSLVPFDTSADLNLAYKICSRGCVNITTHDTCQLLGIVFPEQVTLFRILICSAEMAAKLSKVRLRYSTCYLSASQNINVSSAYSK